jgi:peptide deformylase
MSGRLLKILYYPHPTLRAKCHPITSFPYEPSVLQLAADMLVTVRAQNGLGLAAPQVGSTARLVALRVPAARTDVEVKRLSRTAKKALVARGPHFIIAANPVILPLVPRTEQRPKGIQPEGVIGYEACLSLPGEGSLVRREKGIRLRYELVASSDLELVQRLRRLSELQEEENKQGNGVEGNDSMKSQSSISNNNNNHRPLIVEERLDGLPAIVAQHEVDHLDGILISDREIKHFANSTFDREMDKAQLLFADGIDRYYGDRQAYDG